MTAPKLLDPQQQHCFELWAEFVSLRNRRERFVEGIEVLEALFQAT
ncbi:hypothetical protein [Leptolyngbya sp. BC1307]|nr:hypothetical protein [Leptolyngbya sp. BC1307]